MHIHGLLAWLAFTSLPLAAQNWVTNGDFSNGLTGWTQKGFSYNPALETWDTTGTGASPCFACSPGWQTAPPNLPDLTLEQSVVLVPVTYELTADLSCTMVPNPMMAVDQGFVSATVNGSSAGIIFFNTASNQQVPPDYRARLCGRITVGAAGPALLKLVFFRLGVATPNTPRVRIDNISLQIVQGPTFNFESVHRINQTQRLILDGAPNASYAVFAAGLALPAGLSLPGIQGFWHLDLATTTVLVQGTLDATGKAAPSLGIPNNPYLTLLPVFFQPAQLAGSRAQLGFHHRVLFTL